MLKCIANLLPYNGSIYLDGHDAQYYGNPNWRLRVLYVPQRPPVLDGTPNDFIALQHSFVAQVKRSKNSKDDMNVGENTNLLDNGQIAADSNEPNDRQTPNTAMEIGDSWNLPNDTWFKPWSVLSGGEIQRVCLAIALSLKPDILLLDEPTSALDANAARKVESSFKSQNCIWITHDAAQATRIATDTLVLRNGLLELNLAVVVGND